jgi:hypothetical protein
LEFFVTFVLPPAGLGPEAVRARQLAALDRADAVPRPEPIGGTALSPIERRLLGAKRRTVARLRGNRFLRRVVVRVRGA